MGDLTLFSVKLVSPRIFKPGGFCVEMLKNQNGFLRMSTNRLCFDNLLWILKSEEEKIFSFTNAGPTHQVKIRMLAIQRSFLSVHQQNLISRQTSS